MPELKKLHGSYKSQGLVLIGIHCDPDKKKRDEAVKKNALTYPVCQDVKDATAKAYQIDGYPTVFVIDKKGIVRSVDPTDLEAEIKKRLAEK